MSGVAKVLVPIAIIAVAVFAPEALVALGSTVASAVGAGTVSAAAAEAIGSGIVSGVASLAEGDSVSQSLKNAVAGAAGGYVGAEVGSAYGSAAGQAAGGATRSAISGGSPQQILASAAGGAVSGEVGGAGGAALGSATRTAVGGGSAQDILRNAVLAGGSALATQGLNQAYKDYQQGQQGQYPAQLPAFSSEFAGAPPQYSSSQGEFGDTYPYDVSTNIQDQPSGLSASTQNYLQSGIYSGLSGLYPSSRRSIAGGLGTRTSGAPSVTPTGTTQGLGGFRAPGDLGTEATGKPRQDVWNTESLKLRDALGV